MKRVAFVVFLLGGALTLPAQEKATDKKNGLEGESFVELRNERAQLEKDLPELQSKVDTLQRQITDREDLQREADETARIAAQKGLPPALKQDFEARVQVLKGKLAMMSPLAKGIQEQLDKAKSDLDLKLKRKDSVESRMSQLIDLETPKQQFKTSMSRTFAFLVGAVIVGFFIIAALDQTVRREIFSGQAGIQFITLFSLVIAIILFGITGILEDKELAALLGGLSGYILGRGTAHDAQKSQDDDAPKGDEPPH
jgi:hypothetical protein